MNERIQNLFKIIRKHKHTSNLMSNPPQIKHSYTIDEEDIEKFAELIVRECAGVCEWQYSHKHKDNTEGAFAAIACSDAILEHFGVES